MDFHKLPGSQSAIGSVFRVRANRAGSEFIVIERNKNLRGGEPSLFDPPGAVGARACAVGARPSGRKSEGGKPRPSPGFGFFVSFTRPAPPERQASRSLSSITRSSPLCHPAAPARPYPAPRAGSRSNSRQASGPRHPARAFPVRRRASTMVGTVTSQGGALGERGRLGRFAAGWASLWRLCSSGLALGPRFFPPLLVSAPQLL